MTSLDVVIGRPPKDAPIVGVVVNLELDVNPDEAAQRMRNAAESLRAAGLALMLSPVLLEVRPRRRWWHRITGGSQ